MSALRACERPSLFRAPLRCRLSIDVALRCLHDTERPFALVGAWTGGGALFGCSPVRIATDEEDPFALIARTSIDRGHGAGVGGGWVGYLGYGLRTRIEAVDPSPPRLRPMPSFVLAYYDHVVRCNPTGAWWFEALWSSERAQRLEERYAWWADRLTSPPSPGAARTSDWRLTPSPEGHAALVAACRERILAGDLLQANVCGELEGRLDGPPLELFIRGVKALGPDRAAFLEGPWGAIVSLSPELFLQRRGRRVRTAPIKGTRRRPAALEEATEERAALERSGKDRAENVMIVDLMRNDLGRVCEHGTIAVQSLAQARGHAGVWHLVSEVSGLLRVGVDDSQLLSATFPPGSVTGAPKIAAMNVSSELESVARQAYTGAIGIVSPHAGLELSVAIRTFETNGSTIRLGVGGGVVADSDPHAEATELTVKAAPLLDALDSAGPHPSAAHRAPGVRRRGPVPIPRPDPRRGVFETMRLHDGRALRVESHLARLRSSIAALYAAHLPDSIGDEVTLAARRMPGAGRLRTDIVPDANGGLQVHIDLGPSRPSESARLRAHTLPGGLGCHKWADRRLVAAMEADSSSELPLIVDADGHVLETSRANVFALGRDGVLRTPPDDGRILPGVARADVLAHTSTSSFEVIQAPLIIDDLISARGVVLTNALGATTVLAIDDHPLQIDRRLVARIQAAVDAPQPRDHSVPATCPPPHRSTCTPKT